MRGSVPQERPSQQAGPKCRAEVTLGIDSTQVPKERPPALALGNEPLAKRFVGNMRAVRAEYESPIKNIIVPW